MIIITQLVVESIQSLFSFGHLNHNSGITSLKKLDLSAVRVKLVTLRTLVAHNSIMLHPDQSGQYKHLCIMLREESFPQKSFKVSLTVELHLFIVQYLTYYSDDHQR